MPRVLISNDVWNAIAEHGKFGQTVDDVLRKILNLPGARSEVPSTEGRRGRGNRRLAMTAMSARVERGEFVVEFSGGGRKSWNLPTRSDKQRIRAVLTDAIKFALSQGASNPGQTNAVRKALTDAGYHLTK
jgi:hypothetical protein